ncbi:hypothetical protein GCM10009817_04240 [Terrabacter lapilli]|uniref:Uncharacterized protein n=1 Tax=Terrabacter lapilli TaxID=436231 RepID=A0ABN2RDZ9_9MICO
MPQAGAAPGMLVIGLPPVAMSRQTVLPSPETIAASQEVIAASGVDWSAGPAAVGGTPLAVVLAVPLDPAAVEEPEPLPALVPGELELAAAGPVDDCCVPEPSDFEQEASETVSASATAPVKSFFMEVPARRGVRIGVRQSSHAARARSRRPVRAGPANPPKTPRPGSSAAMICG